MATSRFSVKNVTALVSDGVHEVEDLQGGSKAEPKAPSVTQAPVQAQTVSAVSTQPVRVGVVGGSLVAVAVVSAISWGLFHHYGPTPIKVGSSYVPLAGFIILATALERLLEPISLFVLGTATQDQDAATAQSDAHNAAADPTADIATVQGLVATAAQAGAALDQRRSERTIVYWAIASSVAMLVSGGFGFLLLASVATTPVNTYFDITVTGLAVGAGTKPLHDLFSLIQASSSGSGSGSGS
jgi:hypothetical protein